MKRLLSALAVWGLCMTPCWAGASRDFDGVDDSVNCGSATVIDDLFASGGTIAAWIYPQGWGENSVGRIVDKTGSTLAGYSLSVRDNAAPLAALSFAHRFSENAVWATAASSIVLNQWQHVAVTYDRSASTNDPTCYIGGALAELGLDSNSTGSAVSDSAHDLIIGTQSSTARSFDGMIAYVHIYTRVLSATEINDIMRQPGSIADNLVGYWPLGGADSPELDLSGNGSTGTVTGAAESADGPPILLAPASL